MNTLVTIFINIVWIIVFGAFAIAQAAFIDDQFLNVTALILEMIILIVVVQRAKARVRARNSVSD